jgi:DNA-binding LytR/AlgR family response regulator
MIKVCIIEDEQPAAQRLAKLLKQAAPDAEVVQHCDSIETAVAYLKGNPIVDLLLLDIQLGDGLSFDIFKSVEVDCPVIFTTAFDEFAIKAFELNSIDYLLKPIRVEALVRSIEKFRKLNQSTQPDLKMLASLLDKEKRNYKQRFLVYAGENLVSVQISEISYFYSVEKSTFLTAQNGRSYALDLSLDKLEEMLNPTDFFRINRQYIAAFSSIKKISLQSKSRIKLTLNPLPKEEILVSTARTHEFREWLDR